MAQSHFTLPCKDLELSSLCTVYCMLHYTVHVHSNGPTCDTTHFFLLLLLCRFGPGDFQEVSSQANNLSSVQSEGVCAPPQWSFILWFRAELQQDQHTQWYMQENHLKDPKHWTQEVQVRCWGQECDLIISRGCLKQQWCTKVWPRSLHLVTSLSGFTVSAEAVTFMQQLTHCWQ